MPIVSISGPFADEIKSRILVVSSEGDSDIVLEDGSTLSLEGDDIVILPPSGNPACCPETIVEFVNAFETDIAYTQDLISKHGRTPQVEAYYQQTNMDGSIVMVGAYTRKALIGVPTQSIKVVHGGQSSGFIKII